MSPQYNWALVVGQAGLQVGDVAVQGVVLELLKRRRDPQGQEIGKIASFFVMPARDNISKHS